MFHSCFINVDWNHQSQSGTIPKQNERCLEAGNLVLGGGALPGGTPPFGDTE